MIMDDDRKRDELDADLLRAEENEAKYGTQLKRRANQS